jgi:large conductance mechanosensitive channel
VKRRIYLPQVVILSEAKDLLFFLNNLGCNSRFFVAMLLRMTRRRRLATFHTIRLQGKTMKIVDEFKAFALKGSMFDLAVGVIIGGAFGKIVDSLVKDVIMPVAGVGLGEVDFKQLYFNLGKNTFPNLEAAEKAGAPLVKYGLFINNAVDFMVLAFIVFMMVKLINRLRGATPPPAPPATPEDVLLLREIRDLLKR